MNNELNLALDILKETGSARVGDFRLELDGSDSLLVIGWSQYLTFSNLTKQICINELAEVKDGYNRMLTLSREFEEFTRSKSIEFKLYYDDGGRVSIEICSEKNGVIKCFLD
ncbi:hypothetical protein [Flavihumibacter solisilvae]|uniref:Uncharacterized protein n=1 Tax=Flavihumibacter solisilvae TaxID=1349421 RepID=A0A0C1KY35_9BACT|nr:hypothetical protein [Flavihumibacter solisilvae]KIC92607.1 hypothetical protein OI18_21715 [Flavihumibacter solisilvae]